MHIFDILGNKEWQHTYEQHICLLDIRIVKLFIKTQLIKFINYIEWALLNQNCLLTEPAVSSLPFKQIYCLFYTVGVHHQACGSQSYFPT